MVPVQLKEVGGVDLLVPLLLFRVMLKGLGKGVSPAPDKVADQAAEAGGESLRGFFLTQAKEKPAKHVIPSRDGEGGASGFFVRFGFGWKLADGAFELNEIGLLRTAGHHEAVRAEIEIQGVGKAAEFRVGEPVVFIETRAETEMNDRDERGFAQAIAGVLVRGALGALGQHDVQPRPKMDRAKAWIGAGDGMDHGDLRYSRSSTKLTAPMVKRKVTAKVNWWKVPMPGDWRTLSQRALTLRG